MLQIRLVKSLISLVQMQSVCYSSGLTKKQLLRIRADQKQLYERIIRGNTKRLTASVRKKEEKGEKEESFASKTTDLKASAPSKACEFYWLIQRGSNKNVRIFRLKDVEIDGDVSTNDEFDESSSNKPS